MSADGTFSQHISNMCQTAKNMCGWILRTFESRSPELMLTLWKSLVIPIVDYCSQLWSPSKVGEIQQIENIQKAFTRKIKSPGSHDDYWQRLKHRLYSFERRRERYHIIYMWKILEGIVPNFTGCSKIVEKHSLRWWLCVVNGPRLFNALPSHLRNMTGRSHLDFKKELDTFLQTVADEPLYTGTA